MKKIIGLVATGLLLSGCSLMPKSNQLKGLQLAGAAIGTAQALDCEGLKAAVTPLRPEAAFVDCAAMKTALAAAQALVQAQIDQLGK